MLEARRFTNSVSIVHSDRESLFSNDDYYDFLKHKNVLVSRGSSKGYDNQVVERLHRTIKENLKKACINHETVVIRKNFTFGQLKSSLLKELLNKVIEDYNNTPHTSNFDLSPNAMDEAFVAFNKSLKPVRFSVLKGSSTAFNNNVPEAVNIPPSAVVPFNATVPEGSSVSPASVDDVVVISDVLVKNNSSVESQEVCDLRKQVALRYANNWEQFFLDWRRDQAVKDERLFAENLMLREKLSEVNETLNYVADQTKINEIARHKRELAKQKRELAAKLPLRDVVSKEEFSIIINQVKSKSFASCRRQLALVLLYLTGLRVSNLLILTVKQVKSLFFDGKVIIPLIKNGVKRHSMVLSEEGLLLLNKYKESFHVLCKNKKVHNLVFTTEKRLDKPMNRASFDNELNVILQKCSLEFGKHLRTHSFRATMITDLLVSTPIDQVKEFIGHNDIKSTLTYKRSRLSEECIKKVLRNLDYTRVKNSNSTQVFS
jgi:site-specific recombinase XerD